MNQKDFFPSASERRALPNKRLFERRNENIFIDFDDRRIGDRRKHNRRSEKYSKACELIRFLKETGLYPHERIYDQPVGVKARFKNIKIINLASVDYFNFSQNSEIKKVACEAINIYGAGGFSSRFSVGNLSIHQELENELSKFMGKESVLIFNSGYLANLAVITSIIDKNASIFLDQKCHLSIHHACQLSNKKYFRYNNNDMGDLEKLLKKYKDEPNKWIVTLGVFSSSGFLGRLKEITVLARKYKARTFIDDAHGIGIYGNELRGVADYYDVLDEIDLIMGSFQMAFGNIGAFLVGKNYILEHAHVDVWPYIFTYNIPPVNAACILKSLELLRKNGQELKKKLWENISYLSQKLIDIGYKIVNPNSHIISIVIGNEVKVCEFAKFLFDRKIWVQPFSYPAVPKGKGTIRITCSSEFTRKELNQTLQTFSKAYTLI